MRDVLPEYEITQASPVSDTEIVDLRTAVGWDNRTGPYSLIIPKLYTYFAARKDGQLVGFVAALSDGIADAYIQDLIVHPEHQGWGLGTALMNAMIRYLQGRQIKCIQVLFNPDLEGFYRTFGFHIFKAGVLERDAA